MNELFLRRLLSSPPPPAASDRLCFLTGQSRWETSPLSLGQHAFLLALAGDTLEPLLAGFPFDALSTRPVQPDALLRASLRNARQALSARSNRLAPAAAQVLQGVIDATARRLVIVTGSCGLEILTGAWPRLALPPRLTVEVLSFGPTGRPPGGGVRFQAVQGRRDLWSRLLYRGPTPERIGCGHLDYWTDPQALGLARAFIGEARP